MRRPRPQLDRQRGFTLLELLITLSVTTIGLIGLLSLHLSVSRGNDGASRSTEAQQLCLSELETIRALPVDSPTPGTADMMNTLAGVPNQFPRTRTFPQNGRGGLVFTVTTTVSTIPAVSVNLLKIRVETRWSEDGATFGANGGQLDHALALEVIRTMQEAL